MTAADDLVQLREQLALASEFRVPLTNTLGGYGEVVVERDPTTRRWAVTDGSFTGRRAWHVDRWDYLSDIGRAAAYQHDLDAALKLAQEVAEMEGRAMDEWVAQRRAQLARMRTAVLESMDGEVQQ